jgi:hypothetical protein
MKIEIKNRWTGAVVFECDKDSIRMGVEFAVLSRANLYGASLSGASLSGATLSRADLSRANLSGANLYSAILSGADLSGADLSRANLSRADLSRANLSGADLSGADLSRADLSGAGLSGATLSRAYLSRANLSGADLSDAGGIDPNQSTPLRILLDQPGLIRAYKLVTGDGWSPIQTTGRIQYVIGKTYAVEDANCDENEQCAAGVNLATLDWCMREWNEGYRILIAEFTAADIAAIPTATDGKFRVRRCKIVGEKDCAVLGLVVTEAIAAARGGRG